MVESDNQQQIFIWVINDLKLPSFQGQTYTEWELRQAYEGRILDKSRYYEIIGKFGVSKSTLTYFLNVISPSLKCSYLKHLWYLMGVGKTTKIIIR